MSTHTLDEIDEKIADLAAQKFDLLDHLTRDLQAEIDECDKKIDALLDLRTRITKGESDG